MFVLRHATDDDVIQVGKGTIQLCRFDDRIHDTLETGHTVSDAKRKSRKLIQGPSSFESCIWLVSLPDRYLMVRTF